MSDTNITTEDGDVHVQPPQPEPAEKPEKEEGAGDKPDAD